MVPPVSTSRGYNNWRAEEIACLRYAQEHLAMLDIKVAVSLAFAVKYNASISDPEVLSLSSQASSHVPHRSRRLARVPLI